MVNYPLNQGFCDKCVHAQQRKVGNAPKKVIYCFPWDNSLNRDYINARTVE